MLAHDAVTDMAYFAARDSWPALVCRAVVLAAEVVLSADPERSHQTWTWTSSERCPVGNGRRGDVGSAPPGQLLGDLVRDECLEQGACGWIGRPLHRRCVLAEQRARDAGIEVFEKLIAKHCVAMAD